MTQGMERPKPTIANFPKQESRYDCMLGTRNASRVCEETPSAMNGSWRAGNSEHRRELAATSFRDNLHLVTYPVTFSTTLVAAAD